VGQQLRSSFRQGAFFLKCCSFTTSSTELQQICNVFEYQVEYSDNNGEHFRKEGHMYTPRWIVILILILAISIPVTPVRAARSASLRLTAPTPNPGVVEGDLIFELVIDATDVIPGVAGAEIFLAYDGSVAPPLSPLGVAQALPEFFGVSDISIKEILPASDLRCQGSTNPCIHLVVAGPPQTTHAGAAARFFFRCTTEGTASFRILTSTLVDADGFPVDHTRGPAVSGTCVFRATVKGKVQRQGTPANPNAGGGTLACSVVKLDPSPPGVGPVFTDVGGNFTFTNVPTGVYQLSAEYSGYLLSRRDLLISRTDPTSCNAGTTTCPAGTTTLRGGNANNNQNINILDIGKVISQFGNSAAVGSADPLNCNRLDESSDINDDGITNISDLAITAGNWGCTGPTSWSPDLARCFP
jgi:hypothetical protein